LSIGIPTHDRPDHLNERLIDLQKLGYFNHPDVQIIIHDNDSIKKGHCLKIKDLQKTVRNLFLIESSPNIGMVMGCSKIISHAKGEWITLLGDDDPILMKCSDLLKLIKKNKDKDHLYFKTKIHLNKRVGELSWFPKLKVGNYRTDKLCAKAGFTTHFAFLGSHCFRKKQKMAEIWLKSHRNCMFYGHCVMFIENYKKSFFSGKTVAAWTSGNERISNQLNIMRHLELRNLFKYPPSNAFRNFLLHKPLEVVEQGNFPLLDHIRHPIVEFINEYERLSKKSRIKLYKVCTMALNPLGKILILGTKENNKEYASCTFINDRNKNKLSSGKNASIVFYVGPSVRSGDIMRIIAKLQLMGPIFLNGTKVSWISLVQAYGRPKTMFRKLHGLTLMTYSVLLFGPERLNQRQILINYFTRPRKGLYKIINAIERAVRTIAKGALSPDLYYKTKVFIFGVKHFTPRKKRMTGQILWPVA